MNTLLRGTLVSLALLAGCAQTPPRVAEPVERFSQPPAQMIADRARSQAEIKQAFTAHDYRKAVSVMEDWRQRHPGDLELQQLKPLAYLLMGDTAGWAHARTELQSDWARQRNSIPPPPGAAFTIDIFRHGPDTIMAAQCYERAGRFGVLYKFAVIGPSGQVQSFFTLESSELDNQIARETGQPTPVVTLDHNVPGRHETVAMLHAVPAYSVLRQAVLAYLDEPRPISASGSGNTGIANYGCEIAPHR